MTDTNRPPLWRVMQDAVVAAPTPAESPACTIAAAQIRAVRDSLVPEERTLDPIWFGTVVEHEYNWRQRLRALLSTEADRAERGE